MKWHKLRVRPVLKIRCDQCEKLGVNIPIGWWAWIKRWLFSRSLCNGMILALAVKGWHQIGSKHYCSTCWKLYVARAKIEFEKNPAMEKILNP